MTRYVALLRAVNVGGTGKLPMSKLKSMCLDAGFEDPTTYIASGNVVFGSRLAARQVQLELESRLKEFFGKPTDVFVRTAIELKSVLAGNPFADKTFSQTIAFFLHRQPPELESIAVRGQTNEVIACGKKELYIYYPNGMGRSKLKMDMDQVGTARNMNTVAKLVTMSA
jgi:uncharacterized protein (DUF1697 family)